MNKPDFAINAMKTVYSVKTNRIIAVNVPTLATYSTEPVFYSVLTPIIFLMINHSSATYAIINVFNVQVRLRMIV